MYQKPFEKRDKVLEQNLKDFVTWIGKQIKGDERAEAQTFLNRFFQCFGYDGVTEAGGCFEVPVKNASLLGNTGSVDCLFKDVALFEMKSANKSLGQHYRQLKDYWVELTPKPQYAILCNFKEFWIYDFHIQMGEPVQKIQTADLPNHWNHLLFMREGNTKKIEFTHNAQKITKETVDRLKLFYDSLVEHNKPTSMSIEKLPKEDLQHFVLQCMLCMFAEDIALMPPKFFTDLVDGCREYPERSFDELSALFTHMNNPTPLSLGRFKTVPYFNGGLFAKQIPIELKREQIRTLYDMAVEDWSPIEPAIFGTIFERMICENKRHADGVHYTSEADIEKIIRPTITQYWQEKMQIAPKTPEAFTTLLDEIRQYRVLDPACGSGNFLYKALIELKELEALLIEHYKTLCEKNHSTPDPDYTHSKVGSHQLYGIDKNHFAVELAKLTLEIGRKKAVDRLGLDEDVLPLNNLQDNLICADALFTEWPETEAIIGNPPFIGGKKIRSELGDDYAEKLRMKYPEVKGQVDFCTYWFRKAQDHTATRCGLVASNSIAQGISRKASLDYVVEKGGTIHNAVSSQVWSGEAKVHVSLVNWDKSNHPHNVILDGKNVSFINTSLQNVFDVTQAVRLKANLKKSFEGCQLGGKGFIISEAKAQDWIKKDPKNADVLKPMIDGKAIIHRYEALDWVIDFDDMPIEKASTYALPFAHVKTTVKPEREKNNIQSKREHWFKFRSPAKSMKDSFSELSTYFALPKVTKYTNFQTFEKHILPCEANMVVASDDFYVLGILNSRLHLDWVKAQASTLEDRTRYTNTTCFETFPFLWDAPEAVKNKIRPLAQALDEFRLNYMLEHKIGITTLYNQFFHEETSQLFKLHAKLDKAVCESVYGWDYDPTQNYNESLYALNQKLALAEQTD